MRYNISGLVIISLILQHLQITWPKSQERYCYPLANCISDGERGFESRSCQTKDYTIGICCFSAKHAAFSRKSKDWLVWNQDNVFEWGDMSICRLLFQWTSTIKIQLSVLVLYKADLILISLKINLFSSWYNNNHSLFYFTALVGHLTKKSWTVLSCLSVCHRLYTFHISFFFSEKNQLGQLKQMNVHWGWVGFMVFYATFNNISVISWRSVLLVEETGENYRPAASHWQTLSHNGVHFALSGIRTHNISVYRHWLHR